MPDSEPVPMYKTEPKYTDEAKQYNVTGSVILRADIGIDGTLHHIAVERGLGFGLDESAIECVKSWRFQPARKNWVPYSRPILIQVAFPPPSSEVQDQHLGNALNTSATSTGMMVYTDPVRGFTLTHPKVLQVMARGAVPLAPNCIACLAYDRKAYQHTDLAGAYFWVDIPVQPMANKTQGTQQTGTESDCISFRDLDNVLRLSPENVNEVRFARVTYGGVAAGTASEVELLRTFHRGKCYELGLDISTTSSGYDRDDYSSGRIKHFTQPQERNVRRALQEVVQTFRFLP